MARSWPILLVLTLLFMTGAAAQTVEISPGTEAVLNDADVYLTLFQRERTYFAVYPDAVQLGDQNFSVDSPSRVRLTLEKLQSEVPEGADVINFTANASGTPETRFTATGIYPGTYQVLKDGGNLVEVETVDGVIMFNHSAWTGNHRFAVVRQQPERLSLGTDRIDLILGQEEATTVSVYNPSDTTETVELSVSSTVNGGSAYTRLVTGGASSERVTFDLGPQAQRAVDLVVGASSCSDSCTGTVDIQMESQATGQSYFGSLTVTLQRDTEVHGSPGITFVQLIVIAVLGGAIALRRSV